MFAAKAVKFSTCLVSLALSACSSLSQLPAANTEGYCAAYTGQALKPDSLQFEVRLEVEPLTEGFAVMEGPIWVDDALLITHIGMASDGKPNPANLLVLRDGKLASVFEGYGSNGMAFDNKGYVVAARHKDGSVTRIINGAKLATEYQGKRFNSPNDLVFHSGGSFYFTDPDWQSPKPQPQSAERVYHVSKSGVVTPFGAQIEKPNGVMLSLDENYLYVGGKNGLYKFAVSKDGHVIDQAQQITSVSGEFDGFTKDCAGNLYATSTAGKVYILNSQDELLASFDVPGVTNLAFGGADGKTLFATALGAKPRVYAAEVNIPGFPF